MSKARLVITAVLVEGRSVKEVAAAYGISRGWIYKLLVRYRNEGDAAFAPRSRKPHRSPTATSAETVEQIIALRRSLAAQGLDAGPQTIAWHLAHDHHVTVSPATISRLLTRAGLIIPEPKKRPRSSYLRFVADQPNETWQSDFIHWHLGDGTSVEIISWIDDHSRYALSVTAWPTVTGKIVLATFQTAISHYGMPASVLTDNGNVYTTRLAGGRGGRNSLENYLHEHGITQKTGAPATPKPKAKSNASNKP